MVYHLQNKLSVSLFLLKMTIEFSSHALRHLINPLLYLEKWKNENRNNGTAVYKKEYEYRYQTLHKNS